MINPSILTCLAWIPITALLSFIYWLLMIFLPPHMLEGFDPTKKEKIKAILLAHFLVLFILSILWSALFLLNKQAYIKDYQQQKIQKELIYSNENQHAITFPTNLEK